MTLFFLLCGVSFGIGFSVLCLIVATDKDLMRGVLVVAQLLVVIVALCRLEGLL
jgi:hypothetical protein